MLAEITITGHQIYEWVKMLTLPLMVMLCGAVYRGHMRQHDQGRDIKDHAKSIDRLADDQKRQDHELQNVASGQQQILILLAKLETKLEAIQKSVDKD
ncbi:MAG: hypothetical protein EOP06_00425 [Proteobacteria bacterium]|nr:MAG: hypothetical protein EOP06_00425 [Pseudomonadota bacterium]